MLTPKYLAKGLFLSVVVVSTLAACSESKKATQEAGTKELATNPSEEVNSTEMEVKNEIANASAQYTLQAKKAISDIAKLDKEELAKKYSITNTEGGPKISAMLSGDAIDADALKALGVELQSKTGDMQSALVPLKELGNLSNIKGLKSIDVPVKSNPK